MKNGKIPSTLLVVGLIIFTVANNCKQMQKDFKIETQAKKYYKMHKKIEELSKNAPKNVEKNKKTVFLEENNTSQEIVETPGKSEEESEKVNEEVIKEQQETQINYAEQYQTRMTSYYPAEDTDCTGSGLCSWDFEINDFGAYTYNGKLVVATATEYLLKYGFSLADGVHTYNYYDTLILNIDGVDYETIVLDSCGSSMQTDRIDLFVSGSQFVKDTIIEVRRW